MRSTVRKRRVLRTVLWVGLLASATSALAQQPRFPQLKLEETSGEQRTMAERMLKETRAGISGPWNVLLRSPGLADGILGLYNHFRRKTTLPQRLVEFAILITAREWSASYVWFVHYPLAVGQGMLPGVLADLRASKRPAGMKPDETLVYEVSTELLRKHFVDDATFRNAKAQLGEEQLVDLTALVGCYIAFGNVLNAAEMTGTATEGPEFLPPVR